METRLTQFSPVTSKTIDRMSFTSFRV